MFKFIFKNKLLIIVALILIGPGLFIGYLELRLPSINKLKNEYPLLYCSEKVLPKCKVFFSTTKPENYFLIKDIATKAIAAIVISEDWSFFEHSGFDLKLIKESLLKNLEKGKYSRGASTITQQVAKNLFLSPHKNLMRKIKELYLALKLEHYLEKSKILEIYLNIVHLGKGVYGIGQASKYYFQKAPGQLTAIEGAFLAMLLPNPEKYSLSFRQKELTKYAIRRIDDILKKMAVAGYLSKEEAENELAKPLSFESNAPLAVMEE